MISMALSSQGARAVSSGEISSCPAAILELSRRSSTSETIEREEL